MNYYNEWEKFPAQWLRELAADGLIPEGVVDERSIAELRPEDLAGYNQCHFFAGIGGWPLALRLAGIPADFPIWTGSCPCQPFSTAGKRAGAADDRNLWPDWFELIKVRRPTAVVGEQVASAIAMGWLDRVLDDLESEGHETWACVLPACSVGAPHIRSRLFWAGVRVALPHGNGRDQRRPEREGPDGASALVDGGAACGLADAENANWGRSGGADDSGRRTPEAGGCGDSVRRLGDSQQSRLEGHARDERDRDEPGRIGAGAAGSASATGHWSDAVPILCRDGKTRRVPAPQPGLQRLAHGLPESLDLDWLESSFPLAGKVEGRVGLLKGYGNAIVPQVAAAFLRAVLQ